MQVSAKAKTGLLSVVQCDGNVHGTLPHCYCRSSLATCMLPGMVACCQTLSHICSRHAIRAKAVGCSGAAYAVCYSSDCQRVPTTKDNDWFCTELNVCRKLEVWPTQAM